MEGARFTKNDNEFICEHCGKKIEKLGYTSRDHCNYCLYSKHVDVYPGDRQESCKGLLEPIDVEINPKKGYVIIYRCKKCNAIKDPFRMKQLSDTFLNRIYHQIIYFCE